MIEYNNPALVELIDRYVSTALKKDSGVSTSEAISLALREYHFNPKKFDTEYNNKILMHTFHVSPSAAEKLFAEMLLDVSTLVSHTPARIFTEELFHDKGVHTYGGLCCIAHEHYTQSLSLEEHKEFDFVDELKAIYFPGFGISAKMAADRLGLDTSLDFVSFARSHHNVSPEGIWYLDRE